MRVYSTILLLGMALAVAPARAQQQPEPSGMLESIGRLFEEGAAGFRSHLRGAKERADQLGDEASTAGKNIGDTAADIGKNAAVATKSAVDAVVTLPAARVVQGRHTCGLAPNGAPDCESAALALCRGKGFATGKSIDFTSAEKCPPRVWASGRQPLPGECTTETFISRAMCQ